MKYIDKVYYVCKKCHEAFEEDDFDHYGECPKCYNQSDFDSHIEEYYWYFKYRQIGVFPA